MTNESLIRLIKDNLNEFVEYLDKNDLSQDPNNKAYFVSPEGIKLPFLLVADMWRTEKKLQEPPDKPQNFPNTTYSFYLAHTPDSLESAVGASREILAERHS